MEYGLFLKNGLDRFDFPTILIVGAVATVYVIGFQQFFAKDHWLRPRMARTIGTMLIPDAPNSVAVDIVIQTILGVITAAAYSFVYHFLKPDTVWDFATKGIMIGVVHATFISFFVNMGFSPISTRDISLTRMTALNIASQALFGGIVGMGFGYYTLTADFWRFLAWSIIVGLAFFVVGRFKINSKSQWPWRAKEKNQLGRTVI